MKKTSFILLFVLILLEVAIAATLFVRFGDVAYNGDALYEAQVARNVLSGKGYTTSEMPLYAVNLYEKQGLSLEHPWINTHKFVLPVYLKAGFIKLFGDNLASVTFFFSYTFHLLSLILVYLLARRLWPERPMFAFLSGLIFLGNPVLGFGTPYLMVSGLNLVVDAFLFLLLLYLLLWWRERGGLAPLFAAGLVSGVAFLDRYNAGLYIAAMFLLLLFLALYCKEKGVVDTKKLKRFALQYASYFLGFALLAVALVLWNLKILGTPFLSINGLFQLLFDTRFNSFIDPWYKLEYAFPTESPFLFALLHPLTLAVKWLEYALLTMVRFIAFEGVVWWTPLVLGYFALAHASCTSAKVSRINYLLLFTGILIALQLILLPLWAGSIAYYFYLFPVFAFAIAYFLLYLFDLIKGWGNMGALSAGEMVNRVIKHPLSATLMRALLVLLGIIAYLLLIQGSMRALFAPLNVSYMLLIGFTLVLFGIAVLALLKFPRLGALLFMGMVVLSFVAGTGVGSASPTSEILFERWDLEDNPGAIDVLSEANRGGISLSATPWNTVWWSGNKVPALPIPEYPAEIYLLESRYNQTIDSIYLNKLPLYPFEFISYAWNGYERLVSEGYAIEGFEDIRKTKSGLILIRTGEIPLGTTRRIDVGAVSGNIHLIWGWSENRREGDRTYASIGPYKYLSPQGALIQGTRVDEKKEEKGKENVDVPTIKLDRPTVGADHYLKPDAEMTFLAESDTYRKVTLDLRAKADGTRLHLVLNGNNLFHGEKGTSLGVLSVSTEWTSATVVLPPERINDGINVLSFVVMGRADSEGDYLDVDSVLFESFMK